MKKLLLSILLLCCSAAYAIEPASCRNGFFPNIQTALQLATVNIAKGDKLHFYNDDESCPQAASCKNKAYLIAGDTVIVNAVTEGWACAWFQGKKHETVGWLEAEKLQFKNNPSNTNWSGNWRFYDNRIQFKQVGDKVHAEGEAFWYGAVVAGERVIHTGELNGELKINGNHAHLSEGEDEYSCAADFTLLDNNLIVSDNNNCGGANVSFTGVYLKK